MMEGASSNGQNHKPASDEMLVRRRLLKLGAYVPPAIMGMMILGTVSAFADGGDHGTSASCCPRACNPCDVHPHGHACKEKKNGMKCKH